MFRVLIVFVFVLVLLGESALAQSIDTDTKPIELAARIKLPGGITIQVPDGRKQNRRTQRTKRQPAPGGWQPIASIHGKGTAICNNAGQHFSCFALRCGKGRGLEFAFLFNVGNYNRRQPGQLGVDGQTVGTLQFIAIDHGGELVAPYSPQAHGSHLERLKAGRAMALDIGFAHNFTLRGSSRQIENTLALCADEITDSPAEVAKQQPGNTVISGNAIHQSVGQIQANYRPTNEAFDYGALPSANSLIDVPQFGTAGVSSFSTEVIRRTDDGVYRPIYSLIGNATFVRPGERFFVSDEHAELVSEFDRARKSDPLLSGERADFEQRFAALLADSKSRYGENHPATGFVLESFAEYSLHMRAYASRDWRQSQVERAELYRQIAQAWMQASMSGAQREPVALHTMSAWLGFSRDATSNDPGLKCSGMIPKDEVREAYRMVAAIDHAIKGLRLEQLGWLNAAAECIEDHDLYLEYMTARVGHAYDLFDRQAIARTVSDLARAYFLVDDVDNAKSAYREVFRIHVRDLADDNVQSMLVADLFGNSSPPDHIDILNELGLDAELDYYLAGIVQDYLKNTDFTTRIGFELARGVSRVLEKTGRTDLADQYYSYLDQQDTYALDLMTRFGRAWVDSERYEDGERILERALSLAEAGGDQSQAALILTQLARLHEETGDLETGLAFARRALQLVKAENVSLQPFEIDELNRLVTLAEREQGSLDRVAENLARDLHSRLAEVCETSENRYAIIGHFPTRILLTDPVIADTFLGQPVVRDYVECFIRLRGELPGYSPQQAAFLPSASIGDVLLLLGLMDDHATASKMLDYLFDPDNWQVKASNPAARVAQKDGVVAAYQMAIRGLRLAGKAEWIDPYLANLPRILDEVYVQARHEYRAGLGAEAIGLGIQLLDIGRTKEAQALFRLDEKYAPPQADGFVSCVTVAQCEFGALIHEAAGRQEIAERYYSVIPNQFITENSGANISAWESDSLTRQAIDEGFFHELAGHYRLAEIYYETAASDYFRVRRGRQALATLDDIEISASISRLTFEKGEVAQARALTNDLIDAAQEKLAGNTSYSSDSLIRWSHRLRTIFEVQLDSAPMNDRGEIDANENDFFAFQFLLTTPTAATIAKMADRAANESGGALRDHQDLSRRLTALYSELAVADEGRAEALLAEIGKLEIEVESVKAQIDRMAGGYASFIGMRFPSMTEIQQLLDKESALLLSFVGRRNAYLWLVTSENSQLHRLSQKPEAVESTIRQLRSAVSSYLETGSAELETRQWRVTDYYEPYRDFLKTFEGNLAAKNHLYFVPNGAFDGLPLSALLREEPPSDRMSAAEIRNAHLPWMIRRYSISVLPSVHALKALSETTSANSSRRRPFLGVGDPDFGQGIRVSAAAARALSDQQIAIPPLPETAEEVSRIAELLKADLSRDLLLGENASEARLRDLDLARYRIINFATHGILAGELRGLSEPALILSIPPRQTAADNGLLTSSDVTTLKLDADLVILSACNTAASDGRPGAAGLSGLANAFFYAGARSLVVTHWEIPSKPAVELAAGMVAAYAGNRDLGWPEALQRSAIRLIDETGPAAFAHPAAWGAHMVVGANSSQEE